MKVKILEIRDEGTFIPMLCVDMNPDGLVQKYYLERCGYPCDHRPNIAISPLGADGDPFTNDPYFWPEYVRTRRVAHNYIIDHWNELSDGDVIDVQHIIGETSAPKVSERLTVPA